MTDYKEYSRVTYEATFAREMKIAPASGVRAKGEAAERVAQKEAIKAATLETIRAFPDVEPASIWRGVYEVHVHRTQERLGRQGRHRSRRQCRPELEEVKRTCV